MTIRNGLKETIFSSGGFGLSSEGCTNEDVGPPKRVDCGIPHQLESGTIHNGLK